MKLLFAKCLYDIVFVSSRTPSAPMPFAVSLLRRIVKLFVTDWSSSAFP